MDTCHVLFGLDFKCQNSYLYYMMYSIIFASIVCQEDETYLEIYDEKSRQPDLFMDIMSWMSSL